jgi:hypothetical protein
MGSRGGVETPLVASEAAQSNSGPGGGQRVRPRRVAGPRPPVTVSHHAASGAAQTTRFLPCRFAV